MHKKQFVYHPFLFAIFPILFLYSYNIREVVINEIYLPIIITLGITFSLMVFLKAATKSAKKAGVISSFFVFIFFSYGHLLNIIRGNHLDSKLLSGYVLMPLLIIGFLVASRKIIKTSNSLTQITNVLNKISVSFVVVSLFFIVQFIIQNQNGRILTKQSIEDNKSTLSSEQIKPDIYYIIFDRYGNEHTLKEFFDYDNSEFLKFLSDKGFYISHGSSSNYLKTGPSLVSSLNMEYLNYFKDIMGAESRDLLPLYSKLKNNRVGNFLKENGYTYIHFGSFWAHTTHNPNADINYNLYFLPEFSMHLYKTTAAYPFLSRMNLFDENLTQWKRIQFEFQKLSQLQNISGPKFVFAHLLIPHDPFVFKEDGSYRKRDEIASTTYKEGYIDQLKYTNKLAAKLVDSLLSSSSSKPIIIIQSDEGFFPERYYNRQAEGKDDFDWTQATDEEITQKMGILNSYYFPDQNYQNLYQTITPVNSFRLIFNQYFGAKFELLPDENYIHSDDLHPYNFSSVTGRIKY